MEDMVPIRLDAEARDGRQCMMIDYGPDGVGGVSVGAKRRRLSYEAVVREGTKCNDVYRCNRVEDMKCCVGGLVIRLPVVARLWNFSSHSRH
jgi:hypothetical protein